MYTTPDYIDEPLYVVTSLFNPIRFKARWKHFLRFADHVRASGAVLVVIEAAFGERHHAVFDPTRASAVEEPARPDWHRVHAPYNPHVDAAAAGALPVHTYHAVRTSSEVWLKENLLNLAIAKLPSDWKYVAWVDADVMFARPNWVGETIHQLQHYSVVQMFSHAQNLDPRYGPNGPVESFMGCYVGGKPGFGSSWSTPYGHGAGSGGSQGPYWHPGFAWAARRDAIDGVGGLIDFCVLGAGDYHMAYGLIGKMAASLNDHYHPRYNARLLDWQSHAERHIRRNVGVVEGLLLHYWHGKRKDRKYDVRWRTLATHQFDPDTDLKRDSQGVLQLVDRGDARAIEMRDDIRRYFRERNEDSIDE